MLVGHQTAGWLVLLGAPGLNHDTSPKARACTKRPPELFMDSTKHPFLCHNACDSNDYVLRRNQWKNSSQNCSSSLSTRLGSAFRDGKPSLAVISDNFQEQLGMDSFEGKFTMSSVEQMEQLLEALLLRRENIIAVMGMLLDILVEISRAAEDEWVIKYRLTHYSDFVTIGTDTTAEITTENDKIVVSQTSREKAITVKTVFEMDNDGELVAISTIDSEDAIRCVMKFRREI